MEKVQIKINKSASVSGKDAALPSLPASAKNVVPKKEVLELIPVSLVKEFGAFVFDASEKEIKIAAQDPSQPVLQKFVLERFGEKAKWFGASEEDVQFIIKHYPRDFKDEISRLTENPNVNGNIVEIVDRIIAYAIAEKASDVHIESMRGQTLVRFRVDGLLHKVLTMPQDVHQAMIARCKILANLKIDEYRRPQDGRIELETPPNTSLRISIVPTLHGEKIAMRILDDSNKNLSMENLGFSKSHQEILLRNIEKPFGMMVTSGPTGSGKTTTLYGLLSLLPKDGINISTLEDPIEYALDGVNQIQINPRVDLTFASGLKALLRQDPDIIMVGEIRDSETAVMAANAALTGHMVLTTLHTNDAPSAVTRLLEMKVEDFVVSSIVNLVIAQRLVRKICESCAEERKLDEILFKKITERGDVKEALESMGQSMDQIRERTFRVGKGCDACLGTGYVGRAGIFELLELNKTIHDLILEHAPSERIKEVAIKAGFKDMIADGLEKVFSGVTTFDEVLRTTRNV
ncbi:MAG: GspE/PulE family protein [bacterium]|nr:GspE/PulE family protein [bacterium]